MIFMELFAGKMGFTWFQGVVEDRNDPEQLGRVRVRCLGFHTENKQELPTEDLPWAYPIQPLTSAAMNGIGTTPLGPVEGTWVFGFFRDGDSAQEPMILGTLGGVPVKKSNPNEGFNDPDGIYPLPDYIGEPDTHRIARGIAKDTIVERKINNLDTMQLAGGVGSAGEVQEPPTAYNAQYPFNHVKQTESGHIEEFDDTPGAERLHKYHKTGTFEEIHPDGKKVIKIVGDKYEAILRDDNLHVRGNLNITVEGNSSIYTKNDCIFQVDGNMDQVIGGDLTINAGGQVKITAGLDVTVRGENIRLN